MSKRAYVPDRGDVVHINLGGTGGTREMDGPHFALVISKAEFNRRTGLCVVLPTTSRNHPELGALAVKLPPLPGLSREGWVHVHHVRSIDYRERSAEMAAILDLDDDGAHRPFMDDLIDRLFSIVD